MNIPTPEDDNEDGYDDDDQFGLESGDDFDCYSAASQKKEATQDRIAIMFVIRDISDITNIIRNALRKNGIMCEFFPKGGGGVTPIPNNY